MSASVSYLKTANLVNGSNAVSLMSTCSGGYVLTVKAIKGAVQFSNNDGWSFTPIAIADFTTNTDVQAFHLDEGESVDFTIHEDGSGNFCFASGNASGAGDSVVSVHRRPL